MNNSEEIRAAWKRRCQRGNALVINERDLEVLKKQLGCVYIPVLGVPFFVKVFLTNGDQKLRFRVYDNDVKFDGWFDERKPVDNGKESFDALPGAYVVNSNSFKIKFFDEDAWALMEELGLDALYDRVPKHMNIVERKEPFCHCDILKLDRGGLKIRNKQLEGTREMVSFSNCEFVISLYRNAGTGKFVKAAYAKDFKSLKAYKNSIKRFIKENWK